MSHNRSNPKLAIILLVAAAILLFGRPRIPSILRTLLTLMAIAALLIVAVIIVVFILALKKSKDPVVQAKAEEKNTLTKGRNTLMQLRNTAANAKDDTVRALANDICAAADRILQELKSQPDDVTRMRQFLNYYLPTTHAIVAKYVRVEESGVDLGDMTENVIRCLTDVRTAMNKLYANLFEDDKIDLSVEMETLLLAAKRDGLLDDDALTMPKPVIKPSEAQNPQDAQGSKIELTL